MSPSRVLGIPAGARCAGSAAYFFHTTEAAFLRRANHIIISAYGRRYSTANCINAFRRGVPSLPFSRSLSLSRLPIHACILRHGAQLSAKLTAAHTARRHDTVIYHRRASRVGFLHYLMSFITELNFRPEPARTGRVCLTFAFSRAASHTSGRLETNGLTDGSAMRDDSRLEVERERERGVVRECARCGIKFARLICAAISARPRSCRSRRSKSGRCAPTDGDTSFRVFLRFTIAERTRPVRAD